jgi:hypothetical protein
MAWCLVKNRDNFKGKGKVVFRLLIPRREDVLGSGGIAPCIVNFGARGGEWLASRPGRFTPGERAIGTHWIEG